MSNYSNFGPDPDDILNVADLGNLFSLFDDFDRKKEQKIDKTVVCPNKKYCLQYTELKDGIELDPMQIKKGCFQANWYIDKEGKDRYRCFKYLKEDEGLFD